MHRYAVDENLLDEVDRILRVKTRVPAPRFVDAVALLRGTAQVLTPTIAIVRPREFWLRER